MSAFKLSVEIIQNSNFPVSSLEVLEFVSPFVRST